jgi:hypothetical protein
MPETRTVRVKISSEDAGAISITQVVAQDISLRELVEYMLPLAGKDMARIREILRRGSLVSGASRFRWTGWEAEEAEIAGLLDSFPDPDPGRAFSCERCIHAVLRGSRRAVEIPREAARARRGAGLWEALMEIAAAADPRYADYSYRQRADRYAVTLTAPAVERLRAAAEKVIYTTLRNQVRAAEILYVEFFVER